VQVITLPTVLAARFALVSARLAIAAPCVSADCLSL
jgi:hypothetical protein